MTKVYRWLGGVAAVATCMMGLPGASQAQSGAYPTQNVKVIVPFPPGGPTDVVARIVMQKLSERLGHQFFVENVSGAGGNLGMAQAARATADGYTLLVASSSFTVNPSLYVKTPYDPFKDFAPITMAGASPNALIINPEIPAKTVKELVALIKANPGKYTFASPGIGTTPHLSSEMFKSTYGLDFAISPFAGGAPSIQSVLAGHTPMCFQAIPPATSLIKEGKLRALAVTSAKRTSALPDVPTLDELGIKGQEAETMAGVFAPAGTPKPIVERLQKEIAAIVTQPDIKAKLATLGVEGGGMSTADFVTYIKTDVAKWKKVIADAKIQRIGS
jgi:tripartite-type tricarboxylate transporter receptor subunit TctC